MSLLDHVASLVLKPLAGDAAKAVLFLLTDHWTGDGQRLVTALRSANDRAWTALEVALGGETFWGWASRLVSPAGEDEAVRRQIVAFLDAFPLKELETKAQFRRACLRELREARRQKLLSGEVTAASLREAAPPLLQPERQALLSAQQEALNGVAATLAQAGYKQIANLAISPGGSGPPLMVLAARYYFRLAVEKDPALSRSLTLAQLDQIDEGQRAGFDSLNAAISDHGSRLVEMLDGVADLIDRLREDLAEQGRWIQDLDAHVKEALRRLQLEHRELRPRDSLSIRSESERALVKQLVERFRALPAQRQQQVPDLLSDLARLQVAAGQFQAAERDFEIVARISPDAQRQATACYNAYRAALERQDWEAAFQHLRQAIALDEKRFSPFPVSRYRPLRILGAGGFGVVFLCEHCHMQVPVVVKSILQDDTEPTVTIDNVFREARILLKLDDPAFVRMWDCDYADPANKGRPFLVMDYFDGVSLEQHVKQHGHLDFSDAKTVLREIAQALLVAHKKNVLHRDVKPANVLVRKTEERGWRVKLIDFGLAMSQTALLAGAEDTARLGRTVTSHSIAGTLDYAAPEQLGKLPESSVGPQSDVYSFGKTGYFVFFGTPNPDDADKAALPPAWRKLLSQCVANRNRLPNFEAVLDGLKKIRPGRTGGNKRRPRKPASAASSAIPASAPAEQVLPCPHCRQSLRVQTTHLGHTIRCPACSACFKPTEVRGTSGAETPR